MQTKELYQSPEMEIVLFASNDIITTSRDDLEDDWG